MMVQKLLLVALALSFAGCGEENPAKPGGHGYTQASPARVRQNQPAETGKPVWRTVVRVVDGDTIILDGGERIRLIGVDTPETVHPRKPVEYYGKEASAFTKRTVEGKRVWLEYDQERTDRYGRTLAYVHMEDGRVLNEEIVRQGYGHAYTKYPFKYMERYREFARQARQSGAGLWGGGSSPASARPPPTRTPASTAVYVTRTGSKYHRDGCRYLSRSRIATTLQAAKQRYGPCSVCRPPR